MVRKSLTHYVSSMGTKCLSGSRGVAKGDETTSVALVEYPVSHLLTLRAAIKLHTGPLQMPKLTCLQESTAEKETALSLLMVFLCKRLEGSWQSESWTQMGTARKSGVVLPST